jgi:predicted transcriptional regulator
MDFQRATQAYIWATPAVSFKQWQTAQEAAFGASKLGDFVVYNTLNEKRGIVTANLTTPYVINFRRLCEMATLTIRLPDDKHARLKQLAEHRQISMNKLIDELSTVALAQFDAELRFRARAARGSTEEGLRLLDQLDAESQG